MSETVKQPESGTPARKKVILSLIHILLEDGSFSGIAFGKYCRVAQEGDTISFFDTTPEDFHTLWRPYFDLDRDYGALKAVSYTHLASSITAASS